ncbi:MAG: SMC family ATPase, partial [Planctomycetaceae bacterium]|nr:SMC family ATPase [Planctomycetaceae bacterium]
MKPLQLTMSAFGPYSETQTIDFTRLGENGIYLVTGETGSGKTTIFDAVSFALFGKASGKGRDDYKMLRSDFANEKTRTYVELNFDSGGHRYTIKRTIKKTGKDVGLTLPDKTSVSGETKVNEKIAEIVGLNRDQFSQIVMIAQNDFMRFLQSGSDKRSEILRHIFRTENLKRFQERLKERMKSESDHFNRTLHFFQRYDVDVRRRDVKFAEWESQINADNTVLTNVETRLKDYDERKNRLAGKQAVAEELDKKFADLSKCRNNLARHQAQAEDMVVLRYRTARGEAALRRVKPLADQAKKAADDHSAALAELADAKTRETAAGTEREEAIKAVEVLPPLAEVKDAFDVLKKEWEVSANHLERLAALQNNRKEIRCKQEFLAEKQDELAAVTTGLGTLPLIADCQNELLKISEDLKRAEEKKSGLLPLLNEFSEISDSQVELTEEQKKFAALHEDYCMIDEKYRMMEEAFLRSQAGILAGGLTAGEPCPVCGSVGHPAPAKLSESDVTDAKLKKAKETRDQAQAKREAKSASCGALKTRVETLTRRFAIDLAALIPDATIEAAATLLPEMIRATQSEASEYAAMKSAAEK